MHALTFQAPNNCYVSEDSNLTLKPVKIQRKLLLCKRGRTQLAHNNKNTKTP